MLLFGLGFFRCEEVIRLVEALERQLAFHRVGDT